MKVSLKWSLDFYKEKLIFILTRKWLKKYASKKQTSISIFIKINKNKIKKKNKKDFKELNKKRLLINNKNKKINKKNSLKKSQLYQNKIMKILKKIN